MEQNGEQRTAEREGRSHGDRCGEPGRAATGPVRGPASRPGTSRWPIFGPARPTRSAFRRAYRPGTGPRRTAAAGRGEAEHAYSEAHRAELRELSVRSYKAAQAETREEASHRWKPWEAHELEIITRTDLSIKEAALMLGRTYASVAQMKSRLHRPPSGSTRELAGGTGPSVLQEPLFMSPGDRLAARGGARPATPRSAGAAQPPRPRQPARQRSATTLTLRRG
jgi:hypothetical protein